MRSIRQWYPLSLRLSRESVCGACQGQYNTGIDEQEYVDEEVLSSRDLAECKMLAYQTR